MTGDDFERILAAVRDMRMVNVNGEVMAPLHAVIRVIHSNLNRDDRDLYEIDFKNNRWIKKAPGGDAGG